MNRKWKPAALAMALLFVLTGCSRSIGETEPDVNPDLPSGIATPGEASLIPPKLHTVEGVPLLTVYIADAQRYQEMDIETYVEGVLAGEMRNDWPMEALKAQAILARSSPNMRTPIFPPIFPRRRPITNPP